MYAQKFVNHTLTTRSSGADKWRDLCIFLCKGSDIFWRPLHPLVRRHCAYLNEMILETFKPLLPILLDAFVVRL